MPVNPDLLSNLVPMSCLDQIGRKQVAEIAEQLSLKRSKQLYAIGSKDDYVYYLLNGAISMTDKQGREAVLPANSDQARYAFGNLKPRPSSARVKSDQAHLIRFNHRQLETLITWEEQLSGPNSQLRYDRSDNGITVAEMTNDSDQQLDSSWIMSLLCSKSFFKLPPENIQELAKRMRPVVVKTGDTIVQQGDKGDYYYVIREGRARVIRDGVTIIELGPLTPFGEEALVSGALRNATIQMISNGLLMRLSYADFEELLVPQLINRITAKAAKDLARQGAILVDVRTPEEYANQRLVRSINIPLFMLRARMKTLDPSRAYIVYCDSGIRSAAASFLMAQKGFKSYLLNEQQKAFEKMVAY